MNKLFDRIRNLWIKARLNASPALQRTVILRLHELKEIIRLLGRPQLPIYELKGQGHSGILEVTYIGLEYARPVLENLLFAEKPEDQQVGQIPFWRHRELAGLSSSDIVIVEATKHLIRRLPHDQAIVLPQYVHHIMDVRGNWQDIRSRLHKSIRKNELRWVRKYGYEYDLTHDPQEFETFFYQMYLPTMDARHNELSMPMSFQEAYQYFQHGCLFRVTRDGEWVSGVVCHAQQKVLIADVLGVINADKRLIHQGATAATYYAAIEWANQHGYEAVNFLGSGPYMNTGRFQHKRKWGMTVRVPPHLHRQIWIKVRRVTPAVSQFLKDNPFIVVDETGELHGLIFVDDPGNISAQTKEAWEKSYATPGLNSLIIRSISDFAHEPADFTQAGVTIPIHLNSSPYTKV